MESQQRKERFVNLLTELLEQCDGVKGKLAQKLNIKPSTLSPWLQGKIDPASLDVVALIRLAQIKEISVDETCALLGITVDKSPPSLKFKFRNIIKQLLSDRSQQELADLLQVSQNAISRWTNPEEDLDPAKITIDKIVAIADEKGWTIERLLVYLGLKEAKTENNLGFKLQSVATNLSLNEQIDLLASLFDLVQEKVKDKQIQQQLTISKSERLVCIVLEQEDASIASQYTGNLVLHFHLQPENIKIATISKAPHSLADIDILIFDISTEDSQSIPLIEEIEFDGTILVFAPTNLPKAIKKRIATNVTDVRFKPIDWSQLKNKPYFLE